MSKSPIDFYQSQITTYKTELSAIKKKLFFFGLMRLSIFLLSILAIYLLREQVNIAVISGVVGFSAFFFVVSKNSAVRIEKRRIEKLLELNELEVRVLNRNFEDLDTGEDFVGEEHYYNQDIDLFGRGSIFQFINRTSTTQGRRRLAALLNSNSIDAVETKQEAVKELSELPKWRQNFQTIASLVESKIENTTILDWLTQYKSAIPSLFKYLPLIVTVISIGLMTVFGFGLISINYLYVWFFVGVGITVVYLKKINALYASASQMTDTFSQYAKLLSEIEAQDFKSNSLVAQQAKIKTEGKKASAIFKALSKELNSLDQRNNFLFAIMANGFFLWDLRYAHRIELWINKYQLATHQWFDTIANFDAYNSLGNYGFNNPNHIYPTISKDKNVIVISKDLGHPLLKDKQRITNDFSIKREDFFIITGANMAGKSTFLRTVALNLVLSNVGLPVCAKSFEYTPIKLISSMRTSDSLVNDESYFFSELKRLKFIVDQIKLDEYFIILDEILKGTNSKDKQEGSLKFVEKLVGTNSTGIIATHDLSLCELSKTLPQIENHYFDAEIVNDELYFDYRFKDGICQNMNASFLLRKMEIV
ncbi:MAG: hypothetical protein ACI8ZM_003815 [Crocinitomix sp.]|jgi:hypothetical protein